MSKIDKLGGYKNAKEAYKFLNSCRWHRTPEPDIDALGAELLAYRRANNIFEVEDMVVSNHEDLHLFNDEVLEIEFFRDLGGVEWVRFTNGNDYRVDALRHATDEEIAAGYRGAK